MSKYSKSTNNISKIPVYNLSNQLKSCSIKLFSDIDKRTQECNIMLKISGRMLIGMPADTINLQKLITV